MPDIATALKAEMARIARREIRREIAPAKKNRGNIRADMAALKRRVQTLETQLRSLAKSASTSEGRNVEAPGGVRRVTARSIASLRQRLGLSAAMFGRLLGTSGQSVYNWEAGKAKPRGESLAKIASLKGAGKRDVASYLSALPRQ
jgi:DNA-binding transcriptional regulator YiaG